MAGRWWGWWHTGLILVVAVVAMVTRYDEMRYPVPPTCWEHMARVALNPYLLVYGLLPVFVVHVAGTAEVSTNAQILLRHGSHLRWLRFASGVAGRGAGPLVGALVAVAAVSGAGLTVGQGWRQGLAIESDLAGLVAVGWNPVPLVLVVGVGLVWSLTVIGTVLLLAAAVLSSRLAFVSAATIVLWVIASFQLGLPSWANVADGLVLTMALDDIAATPFALFVPAAGWAAMCLLAAWLVDRRLAQDRPAVVSRLPWLVPPLAVVAMSGLVPAGSAADLLWGSFYGTDGTSPPSLVAYAFLVIVFFGPVYAALVDMERVMDCPLVFQLVRRGGPGRWWWCLVGRAVGRYACYVAGLGLWAVVVASVRARGQFGSRPESSWAWLAWQFGVNGILQGGLYLGVCCLVRWITGRTVGGLAALAVLIGVGLWLSPLGFPVLQNSLGLLEAESPLAVSIRLTAWLSGCATIAAVALSRPGRPLVERNLVP